MSMTFSIVTPTLNSQDHLQETILSVLAQRGDFYIDYTLVDGGSTDETLKIIEHFDKIVKSALYPINCLGFRLRWLSQPDRGMYDAINRGFEHATGDIFAWINSDDIYLPGAFATIAKIFSEHDDIHWLKGITSYSTESTNIWRLGECHLYTQDWIKAGIYGRDHHFIQQDSVFWRSWLWHESGGIDASIKRAGDYYLWIRFGNLAPLVTVKSWLSCFRTIEGQLSQDIETYMAEVMEISTGNEALSKRVRLFLRYEKFIPQFVKPIVFWLGFGHPEFSLVLVTADGITKRIMGDYYTVRKAL